MDGDTSSIAEATRRPQDMMRSQVASTSSQCVYSENAHRSEAQQQRQQQKGSNGWSLLGFLPLAKSRKDESLSPTSSLSSASLASAENNEFTLDTCKCCGSVVKYPANVQKYRCVYCKTDFITSNYDFTTPSRGIKTLAQQVSPMTFSSVKTVADSCFRSFQEHLADNPAAGAGVLVHFKPLEDYLYPRFSNSDCLNKSFRLSREYTLTHAAPNINFHEVHETFKLLLSLPVKKPFFTLLTAANVLLHSPPVMESPGDLNWLLIFLELPTLPHALHLSRLPSSTPQPARVPPNLLFFESKEVKAVSYKVAERSVGLLANCNEKCISYLINWFAKYSEAEFRRKVELINLFITFHLRLVINKHYSNGLGDNAVLAQPAASPRQPNGSGSPELVFEKNTTPPGTLSQLASLIPAWNKNKRSKKNRIKLKIDQYGYDWHLKVAAKLLSFFYRAWAAQKSRLECSDAFFYNSLVDFINVKQDFDTWQTLSGKKSTTKTELNVDNMTFSVNDYLQTAVSSPLAGGGAAESKPAFAFCQFPFLLSLAAKIAILEYEAKRQMEKKAEEAFLHAINKKTIVEVYFKVRVRREHITNDSLRCIKESQRDLKKSLKIEFVGEPGVDAGGLKKEWFLILSKKLFDPAHGLFYNVPESNFLWFTLDQDTSENLELYYLVGVVLGLAIYNSTILDLKFPPALYKLLLDKEVGFSDYLVLFPETGLNLKKLASYDGEQFDSLFDGMCFELNYKNLFGELQKHELVENGAQVLVTAANKGLYIKKYARFFLVDGIQEKFAAFKKGFQNVINGNALSLFSPQEIELILCGSDEGNKKFDLQSLRSVVKYNGFIDSSTAMKIPVVVWFWEFFESLSIDQQKKLMLFITGSDRIPATGIVSMSFKVTRLGADSERLPVAHTCFNELCLYEYRTKEKLVDKLSRAMNDSEGFGIK